MSSNFGFLTTEWSELHDAAARAESLAQSNTGLRVYSVSSNYPALSVFLTTANFTNSATGGNALDPKTKPYGDKGFVVFRKDGSGAILQPKQAGQTNVVEAFVPLCK